MMKSYRADREYLLLKRFSILTTVKRRAILQLISDPNESF